MPNFNVTFHFGSSTKTCIVDGTSRNHVALLISSKEFFNCQNGTFIQMANVDAVDIVAQ